MATIPRSRTPVETPSTNASPTFPAMPYMMRNSQVTWSSDSLPLRHPYTPSGRSSVAGSFCSTENLDIDLMLNPILDTASNHQAREPLPSIWTLDMHRYGGELLPPMESLDFHIGSYYQAPSQRVKLPSPFAQPSSHPHYPYPAQSALSPRDRHHFKYIKRRDSFSSARSSASPTGSPHFASSHHVAVDTSITSCPADYRGHSRYPQTSYFQSMPQTPPPTNYMRTYTTRMSLYPEPPQRQSQPVTPHSQSSPQSHSAQKPHQPSSSTQLQGHSNRKYTEEERHFIQYQREDKRMQWADIAGPFNAQFPNHKRERGALECRYYRFQMYPKVDDNGNFVYDSEGQLVTINIKIRERREMERQGGKAWQVMAKYIKLVDLEPEMVVSYSWTEEEDKRRAMAILEKRARNGSGKAQSPALRILSCLFRGG